VLLDAGIALLEALNTLREKEGQPGVRARWTASSADRAGPAAVRRAAPAAAGLRRADLRHRGGQREDRPAQALAQHARYLAWVDALRSRLVAAWSTR
jgi:general secretion pathway protein F